jgi:hypothetical protein
MPARALVKGTGISQNLERSLGHGEITETRRAQAISTFTSSTTEIKMLPYVVTHIDNDHVGGIIELVDARRATGTGR